MNTLKTSTTKILQKSTVRIRVGDSRGSGVIYAPSNNSAYFYVFTAKHCICKKGVNCKDSCEKNCFYASSAYDIHVEFKLKNSRNFKRLEVERVCQSPELDFVILCVPKRKINQSLLKELPNEKEVILLDSPNENYNEICWCRGYPQVSNNKAETIDVKINELDDNAQFEIRVKGAINTFHQGAKEVVEGFSGSGIFLQYAGKLYLTGIVKALKSRTGAFNMVIAVDFSQVNEIDENWLPEIDTDPSSVLDFKIKKTNDSSKSLIPIKQSGSDLFKQGREFYRLNSYVKALQLFKKAKKTGDCSANERKSLGNYIARAEKEKKYANAIKQGDKCFKERKLFPAKNSYEEAKNLINRPNAVKKYWHVLGEIQAQEKEFEKAKKSIERAINRSKKGNYSLNEYDEKLKIILQGLKDYSKGYTSEESAKTNPFKNLKKWWYSKKAITNLDRSYIANSIEKCEKNFRIHIAIITAIFIFFTLFFLLIFTIGDFYQINKREKYKSEAYNLHADYMLEERNPLFVDSLIRTLTLAKLYHPKDSSILTKLKEVENERIQEINKIVFQNEDTILIKRKCSNNIWLAKLKANDFYGYVNPSKEVLIAPKYEKIYDYKNSLIDNCCFGKTSSKPFTTGMEVQLRGERFYIDKNDNCIFGCP